MIRDYLKYRRGWYLFQILIAATVTSVFLLDPFLSPTLSNVLYLNLLILFWNALFFAVDFRKYKRNLLWIENFSYAPPTSLDSLLLKALDQMKSLSEEKDRAILKHNREQQDFRDFINGWIHAVKTPLFASKMLLDAQTFDTPHQQLAREVENIETYINQALFYARLETFADDYHISLHSVDKIASRSLKQFRSSFILRRLSISYALTPSEVLTDDKWLKFVLDQLISNAVKYAKEGSEISVDEMRTDDYYCLSISNMGDEIPVTEQERIFNRGYTGATLRAQNQSTGMGLYLAKRICDKLGHAILVSSSGGKTTFTLRFKWPDDHHRLSVFSDLTNL